MNTLSVVLLCWLAAGLGFLFGWIAGHGVKNAKDEGKPVSTTLKTQVRGTTTAEAVTSQLRVSHPGPRTQDLRALPVSQRGEHLCVCGHDQLDHSSEPPEPCFSCDCPAYRELTGGRHRPPPQGGGARRSR